MKKREIIRSILMLTIMLSSFFLREVIPTFLAGCLFGASFSIFIFSSIGSIVYQKTIKKIESRIEATEDVLNKLNLID